LIPCFGFGDGNFGCKTKYLFQCSFVFFKLAKLIVNFLSILSASTHDQDVFSFYSEERLCNGFEEVLARYREIVPQLKLAGVAFTHSHFILDILVLTLRFPGKVP